jgi:hypothetical protein
VHNDNPNYCRLVYNTAFPWEANNTSGAFSSSLTLKSKGIDKQESLPLYIDVAGFRENVFYRQASFKGGNFAPHVDMASIVIPGGEIRVERLRKVRETSLFLGHFSMPHMNGEKPRIQSKTIDGKECLTLAIKDRQLAMCNVLGWDKLAVRENEGLHPEAQFSSLLYAEKQDQEHRYGPVEILVSVLLHKTDDQPWNKDELQPVKEILPLVEGVPLHLGGLRVILKSGTSYAVDFKAIDGASSRH